MRDEFREWWLGYSDPIKADIAEHSYGEVGHKRKRYGPGKTPPFEVDVLEALLVLDKDGHRRRLQPYVLEAVGQDAQGMALALALWRLLATGELHERQKPWLAHEAADQLVVEMMRRRRRFPAHVRSRSRAEASTNGRGKGAEEKECWPGTACSLACMHACRA